MRGALLLPLSVLLLGCPGPVETTGELKVEVGTGAPQSWHPTDGGFDLIRGGQGGQHVWVGLRLSGTKEESVRIDVRAYRIADNAEVSFPLSYLATTESDPDRPGELRITGLTCQLRDPQVDLGKPLRIEGKVADGANRLAVGEMRGTVREAPASP